MTVLKLPYKISSCGLSDIGLVRQNNEDYFAKLPQLNFFALADGMGGHKAGEVAAKEAVQFTCYSMEEFFLKNPNVNKLELLNASLKEIIQKANGLIHHLGKKKEAYHGMGTTLCSMLFFDDLLIHAHVGDSRLYCFRYETLSQLTRDHSRLTQYGLSKSGGPCYKNVLTRAIGTSSNVNVDLKVRQVLPGDYFLMCSDGLSDYVSKEELTNLLLKQTTLKKKTQSLINAAKENGGNDNITVILTEIT